ncbi:cache domain-containing protein [Stigmatella sp. ncwal1]|uniref:histidine kinase n=1 Tax=Stigmatella ashevillensis TaxID=2995309 RepID=A0ABT5DC72_9BACT|nr:cache domain-containing protein [Stigmatella ashevillena]MDC0711126.1 cache domain-containing protein [Stigmatella ashevillena]
MPRLPFHRKLLLAFAAVLLPVLVLLCADFVLNLQRTQQTLLDAQGLTAQAVAVQVADSLDAAVELGWALANDPLVRTLDAPQLDEHLQRLARHLPRYDAIGVYDASGLNRGWGVLGLPAEPRLQIGDRPYFQRVMATNAPVVSEVLQLRRPLSVAMLVSVPVRDARGRAVGVVNVVMQTERLAQRYQMARLQPGQDIMLMDSRGRLAFHTGYPHLSNEQSLAFAAWKPLQEVLLGSSLNLDRFVHPLTQELSLGAFVSTPRHRWVVGVASSRDSALAPLYAGLRTKLLAFGGILLLSGCIAVGLARLYSKPVRRLQLLAHALGKGALEQRVRIRTGDELEDLGTAFNEMAGQIAQRQREVNALRAETEHHAGQLRAIIASVPDAIFLASPEGVLCDANLAGLRLLGIEGGVPLNMPFAEFLRRYHLRHLDGRPMALAQLPLHRALSGETFTDVEMRLRDPWGQERLLSANGAPVKDASGNIILGETVIHDITGRRKDEEERSRLLDRERALARIGQALVREVELERIAHVASEQSLHALGADAVGLWLVQPGQPHLTLLVSHGLSKTVRERCRELPFEAPLLTAQAAREEKLQVIEDIQGAKAPPSLSHTLATGEGFRSLVSVPLHSRNHLVGVMTCFTNTPRQFSSRELEFHITVGQLFAVAIEKARLFQEVREALRLREEFMSAAAHELRTPVTTIQTWADILSRMEEGSVRQQKGLAAIARSTRRLARLVEHLFSAVWMAPGLPKLERDRLDLKALVTERVKSLSRTTENPIYLEADDVPAVDADHQRMGEVVAHLLENAIRYSPPLGPIEVRLSSEGNRALCCISDHGPGIPLDRQPHVFEPLYEPLPSGAPGYVGVVGMGLHLSWQIIEAHGGHIWLESVPGEGSTFCFSLPVQKGDPARPPACEGGLKSGPHCRTL